MRVKTESPGLPQSEGENLAMHPSVSVINEGIVLGDAVWLTSLAMIHINPQHLAGKRSQVLGVSVGILLRAAIAHADIQVSIRSEFQSAAVVKLGSNIKLQHLTRRLARVGT